MKRVLAGVLFCLTMIALTACKDRSEAVNESTELPVTLQVITTFAGSDGNAQNYKEACRRWEEISGDTLVDMSAVADDSFKQRISMDFATGSEPDVLFFFTGADASGFIEAEKVIPLDEIRKEYPDYAINQDESKLPTSLVDNRVYAVPVNGYWEAMFVNTKVLEASGVKLPDRNYTWEQFMEDCGKIKNAGYVPIAAALGDIPNYWWEFSIFNHTGPEVHMTVPGSVEDTIGQAWVAGLENIKSLYELGYFPSNTTSARDEETLSVFMNGGAAFLLDGSWRMDSIIKACQTNPDDPSTLDEEKLKQFGISYVPGTEKRETTDLIGGVSMGYYITRKAWNDSAKREAAVKFVTYMTSEEVVMKFARYSTHTLAEMPEFKEEDYNSLQQKAIEMLEGVSSFTPAVQDIFSGECRSTTFAGMVQIITGQVEAQKAVEVGLSLYHNQ